MLTEVRHAFKHKSLTVKHKGITNFSSKTKNTAMHTAKNHWMMIHGTYHPHTPGIQPRPLGLC